MTSKRILLFDNSTMRSPFLCEMLQESGEVREFSEMSKAMAAIKRGLDVDVAVLHYRIASTPLIQALRQQRPGARIIAFGSPRRDTPLGVDAYINQPILSADLRSAIEKVAAKGRAN